MGERGIARRSVHEIVPRFRSAPPSPNSRPDAIRAQDLSAKPRACGRRRDRRDGAPRRPEDEREPPHHIPPTLLARADEVIE